MMYVFFLLSIPYQSALCDILIVFDDFPRDSINKSMISSYSIRAASKAGRVHRVAECHLLYCRWHLFVFLAILYGINSVLNRALFLYIQEKTTVKEERRNRIMKSDLVYPDAIGIRVFFKIVRPPLRTMTAICETIRMSRIPAGKSILRSIPRRPRTNCGRWWRKWPEPLWNP